MHRSVFSFGGFSFDDSKATLFQAGVPVRLGRRSAALLGCLLRQRGGVLTKAELLDAAWPRTAVEESNLSVQISQLRNRLGKAPGGGDWIATVSGVGYRFLPEAPAPGIEPSHHPRLPSLAVLPFDEFGHDGRGMADGLVEELTTALCRFKSLAVVARRSSFQYRGPARDVRQVAAELGVRYIVEGSTRQIAGKLRIVAQLIDGISGAHLWAQSYDAVVGDDSAIAGRLAATLEAQVHAAEIVRIRRQRAECAEAYAYYLQGRALVQSSRPEDNALGYGRYLKALELEPDNVEFLAAAAEAMHHRLSVGWDPLSDDDRRLALAHVRRGVDLVGTDAVSMALFGITMMTTGDEDLGLATARRAVAINDNSPLVLVVAGLANSWAGDVDEGEAFYRRSLMLNPTDPTQRFALDGLAKINCIRENFEDALMWAKRANAFSHGLSGSHWNMIAAAAQLGRRDEAQRYVDRYRSVSPGVTVSRIRAGQPYRDRERLRPMASGLLQAGLPEA